MRFLFILIVLEMHLFSRVNTLSPLNSYFLYKNFVMLIHWYLNNPLYKQ